MSSRLMIVLTTISIVGSAVASGALAAPYHGAGEANAAVGEVNQSGYGFSDEVSKPHYHGGPKSSY